MKYLMLLWAGLARNKTRTILTMISITIIFLLFGLLQGINLGFKSVVSNLNVSRIYTSNKNNLLEGMPIAYLQRVAAIQGVEAVSHLSYFSGYYQDSQRGVGVFATDPQTIFKVYNEIKVSDGALEALAKTRTGAVIAKPLLETYGWKVGDTVPIGSRVWRQKDGSYTYPFTIVGTFEGGDRIIAGPTRFYMHFDYFDAARRYYNNTVHYYVTRISDPRRAAQVSAEIDRLFSNSSYETRTQSEQSFAASALQQVANVELIVNLIVGAVMFALLFLVGSTMMQSMRERIGELALLKALGFTDRVMMTLVSSEALLMCLLCAFAGLALSIPLYRAFSATFGSIPMPPTVFIAGAVIACLLAVISSSPALLRARQIDVAAMMRRN